LSPPSCGEVNKKRQVALTGGPAEPGGPYNSKRNATSQLHCVTKKSAHFFE